MWSKESAFRTYIEPQGILRGWNTHKQNNIRVSTIVVHISRDVGVSKVPKSPKLFSRSFKVIDTGAIAEATYLDVLLMFY